MELQIKSLDQRTTCITISKSASVSDLKQEIKITMDVDSHRQRLIFQGRVLKDDKQLTDYGKYLYIPYNRELYSLVHAANLEDGKVIHLVIRPADAPHNPLNGKLRLYCM